MLSRWNSYSSCKSNVIFKSPKEPLSGCTELLQIPLYPEYNHSHKLVCSTSQYHLPRARPDAGRSVGPCHHTLPGREFFQDPLIRSKKASIAYVMCMKNTRPSVFLTRITDLSGSTGFYPTSGVTASLHVSRTMESDLKMISFLNAVIKKREKNFLKPDIFPLLPLTRMETISLQRRHTPPKCRFLSSPSNLRAVIK